jgi:hypothetical protein
LTVSDFGSSSSRGLKVLDYLFRRKSARVELIKGVPVLLVFIREIGGHLKQTRRLQDETATILGLPLRVPENSATKL